MGNSFEDIERAKDLTELGLDWLDWSNEHNSDLPFFDRESEDQPEPEIYNELAAKHWKLLRTMPMKFLK